jgi:ATP-binding cassette, subfamily B, bacterial MsbA
MGFSRVASLGLPALWFRVNGLAKNLKNHAISRVLMELKPHKGRLSLVLALGLIIAAIQPVAVNLVKRIVDELQKGKGLDPSFFRWVPLSLIIIFLVSGFAKYFHNTYRRYITEKITIAYRTALFRKYLYFPLSVLDQSRTGAMLSTIQNDLAQINQGIDTFILVCKEPFTFIGLLAVAFFCDWKLTLITLIVAPVVAYLFSRSGSAVKRYSNRNLDHLSDILSVSQEAFSGARVVKVFQLEGELLQRFRSIHERYFVTAWKSIKVQELATPVVEFIGAILIAGVLLYGGYRTANGDLTSGPLVAFVVAIGLAQMPLKQMNNAYLKLKNAEAAAERVYRLLDSPNIVEEERGFTRKSSFVDSIVYENVHVTYGEKSALRGVSFEVKRGECVAFVGHSGSGKTSIVNLLPRLYEISAGSILLDGARIEDIHLDDLRHLISFVTQDTFLFNDSVYENIRFGRPDASEEDIEEASSHAHCLDFIKRLPQGFHTRIGDRGVCLSGGERQRLAIARAFLKGAPILVLDEATSSLDSGSEAIVQEAIEELIQGRTTFLVAHRLSTVRRANRIFVVEDGKIRETGSHDELFAKNGLYTEFVEKQSLTSV